jgi:hypothetical protein
VHGVAQQQSFPHPAVLEDLLNLGGDIDEFPPPGCTEPQLFSVAFHISILDSNSKVDCDVLVQPAAGLAISQSSIPIVR